MGLFDFFKNQYGIDFAIRFVSFGSIVLSTYDDTTIYISEYDWCDLSKIEIVERSECIRLAIRTNYRPAKVCMIYVYAKNSIVVYGEAFKSAQFTDPACQMALDGFIDYLRYLHENNKELL